MNNKGFQVGEVVTTQNFVLILSLNGQDVVITGGYELRDSYCSTTLEFESNWCYEVRWQDGSLSNQDHHQLRRKQPPADTSAWADSKIADLQIYRPELVGEPA